MLKAPLIFAILSSLVVFGAASKKTDGALAMAAPLSAGGSLKEGGAACSSEQNGVPGSSFIQNAQNATKMILSRESAKNGYQVNASAASHLGTMDRATSDLITVFFVVAILLFVSVLGFIMVEASFKKKSTRDAQLPGARAIPGAGRPFEPHLNDRFSTTREPMPRASVTRPVHQAPRPSVPGTGMSAVSGPASSRNLAAQAPAQVSSNMQDSVPEPSSLYLCGHELVVPDLTECNLVIPSIQSQSSVGGKIEVIILDSQGSSILRGDIYKAPLYDGTRIELKCREGANTWARCRDNGVSCFTLHGKGDQRQPWGSIKMSAGGVIDFQTSRGQKVSFAGPASGKMNIVDSHGILLGVSDVRSDGGRSVRVGPLVDVGFVMICHLAIDLFMLEASGRLR